LIMSQILTLYTTPVVYLYLDRLRLRVLGKHHDTFNPDTGHGSGVTA
jgi:multidrug efflux pump